MIHFLIFFPKLILDLKYINMPISNLAPYAGGPCSEDSKPQQIWVNKIGSNPFTSQIGIRKTQVSHMSLLNESNYQVPNMDQTFVGDSNYRPILLGALPIWCKLSQYCI